MNGNKTQYDPSEMFREWIQKSGKAQAEFMRNFGAMMGQPSQSFDPLQTLKEIAEKTSETQTNFMENFSSMQTQGLNKMFNLSQMMPNWSLQNFCWYQRKNFDSRGRKSCPRIKGRRFSSSNRSSS